MLSVRGEAFDSASHIYEVKWDGTRCIAFIDNRNNQMKLQNRRFYDISYRYPDLKILSFAEEVVLDGEIVVLIDGKPDFKLLQKREQVDNINKIRILSKVYPATYVVFDVLYVDGDWLFDLPLIERKSILKNLDLSGTVLISDYVRGRGKRFYREVVELGFEGVVAKREDSPYVQRRSRYWVKIKKRNSMDCIILGYMHGSGLRGDLFGSLILGLYERDLSRLRYVGKVGTGFDRGFMEWFVSSSEKIKVERSYFNVDFGREVTWIKPYFVCEVEFLELSEDGRMRAPVFRKMRLDKDPKECTVEQLDRLT
jgi:bifunctional non-homologous end joining protein LigD